MAAGLLLVTCVVILSAGIGCRASCDISPDPTSIDIRRFIECAQEELYSLEQDLDNNQYEPQKQQYSPSEEFINSVTYEEMDDFSYCRGLRPQQCLALLQFLEYLTQYELQDQFDYTSNLRFRRSFDPSLFNRIVKYAKPGALDSQSRKNIKLAMQWSKENGRGKHKSRFGRSVDFLSRNTPKQNLNSDLTQQSDHPVVDSKPAGNINLNDKTQIHSRQKRNYSLNIENLKMTPELQEILTKFKTWREKHGYGKAVGRWG